MEPNASAKQISFSAVITPNLKTFADKNMLETILRNLIFNAIKLSKDSSTVEIHGSPDLDRIRITVKDYGLGMSKEQAGKRIYTECAGELR